MRNLAVEAVRLVLAQQRAVLPPATFSLIRLIVTAFSAPQPAAGWVYGSMRAVADFFS